MLHPLLRFACGILTIVAVLSPAACSPADPTPSVAASAGPGLQAGKLLFRDDFSASSSSATVPADSNWRVEQQPGGSVTIGGGRLLIEDRAGCTVWFAQRLRAPVAISYVATVSGQARVSDLNCFWMATDSRAPDSPPFAPGFERSGKFAEYDSLRTYYVGYGGNTNSTTRFRRYAGSGAKPLLPEHDLRDAEYLLVPDHTYHITLVAANGRVRYIRDGETVFEWVDPEPLTEGYFAFRTVDSRIVIRDFQVHEMSEIEDAR